MQRPELAWRGSPFSEGIENLQRFAIEDHHFGLAPVADVQETLFRIAGKCRARCSRTVAAIRCLAFAPDEYLVYELPVQREHLHAFASTIGHVYESVIRYARCMHRLNKLRSAFRIGIGQSRVWRCICWNVAEGAPHSFEFAGVRIEHNDPAITVTIGDKQFVRFWVYEGV